MTCTVLKITFGRGLFDRPKLNANAHLHSNVKWCRRSLVSRASETMAAPSSVVMRIATEKDVPHILLLIQHLAEFEKLTDECVATEENLANSLFQSPPFKGPTVIIQEITGKSHGEASLENQGIAIEEFSTPIDVLDPEREKFRSVEDPSSIIVGFALFFPNYSTFLAKHGFYLEDLCIREPYRRFGFGTKLLRRLAKLAVQQNAGRLEWAVLDWNEKAINFYTQRIGASIMNEWRTCRLTGSSLLEAGKEEN